MSPPFFIPNPSPFFLKRIDYPIEMASWGSTPFSETHRHTQTTWYSFFKIKYPKNEWTYNIIELSHINPHDSRPNITRFTKFWMIKRSFGESPWTRKDRSCWTLPAPRFRFRHVVDFAAASTEGRWRWRLGWPGLSHSYSRYDNSLLGKPGPAKVDNLLGC